MPETLPVIFCECVHSDIIPEEVKREVLEKLHEAGVAVENIRPIGGASATGVVELSRGCGRGCKFCTMASTKMSHLTPEAIIADIETRITGGVTAVVSVILGLPGEAPDDVARTLDLVKRLAERRAVVSPILNEPVRAGSETTAGQGRSHLLAAELPPCERPVAARTPSEPAQKPVPAVGT